MNGHSKAATLNGNGSVEHRPESETHDPAAANGKARLADTGITQMFSTAFKRIFPNACAFASAECDSRSNNRSHSSCSSSSDRSKPYANHSSLSSSACTNKSIDVNTALVTNDSKSSTLYQLNDSSGASVYSQPGVDNGSLSQQRQYKYSIY